MEGSEFVARLMTGVRNLHSRCPDFGNVLLLFLSFPPPESFWNAIVAILRHFIDKLQ